jgi:hypothetical protein
MREYQGKVNYTQWAQKAEKIKEEKLAKPKV